jgi:hypothetical protein
VSEGASLREQPNDKGRLLGALQLNGLELRDGCQSHFLALGIPTPREGPPVYVSFLPNILSAPNLLTNLVLSMGIRSRWAVGQVRRLTGGPEGCTYSDRGPDQGFPSGGLVRLLRNPETVPDG